jgi:hypothetical protein
MPRIYEADELPPGRVLEDGEGIHVRMQLCDSVQRQVRDKRTINDALSQHQALASHRPGYCRDILRWNAYDAALEVGLADAIAKKDRIRAEQARLGDQKWKLPFADQAPLNALPEPNYELQFPPDDDDGDSDNGSDDDSDSDNGSDDDSELAQAMKNREAERVARDRRGDSAWRTMNGGESYGALPARSIDPRRADETERVAESWRHGK